VPHISAEEGKVLVRVVSHSDWHPVIKIGEPTMLAERHLSHLSSILISQFNHAAYTLQGYPMPFVSEKA
jgi:hypothetical protein